MLRKSQYTTDSTLRTSDFYLVYKYAWNAIKSYLFAIILQQTHIYLECLGTGLCAPILRDDWLNNLNICYYRENLMLWVLVIRLVLDVEMLDNGQDMPLNNWVNCIELNRNLTLYLSVIDRDNS